MCGIAGVIGIRPDVEVGRSIERLTDALAHRGPDGSGIEFIAGRWAALGHRRLSIVDIAGGAQPMANEDGRVRVVFNGEIYNQSELRKLLEASGHRFRTRCDTEVLVHGWEEWGPELFERLNGIYAFAIHDGRGEGHGQLWLVRDPVGAKPLYLGQSGEMWWFASELSAARAAGLVEPVLRPEALEEYLVYRFVPSPGTIYADVWKVPPGHFCWMDLDDLPRSEPSFHPFTPRFEPATLPATSGEWCEALRDGLAAAVGRQLMSDVPVGTLLSGGIDSTVVTRFMRDDLPEPPTGFAIGFDGDTAGELAQARRAAAALGVPLETVTVTEAEYLATWPGAIAGMGEPIANSGVHLVGLLCRRVGQTHKVVLSGQGADEPLGGYPRHAAARLYPLARRLQPLLAMLPERMASSDRLARLRRLAGEPDEAARFAEILAVFSPREATQLTGRAGDYQRLADPVRRWLPRTGIDDGVNRLLRVDARLSLADDLLTVADHMSMASSVELRVPFLDLELLALMERMPSRFKVSKMAGRKWLYRRAVAPLLPPELRSSLTGAAARMGRKLGFTTPLDRWFGQWIHRDAEHDLLGGEAMLPEVLSPAGVRQLLVSVRDRGLPRSRQLLSLYVLEAWLQGALGSGQPRRSALLTGAAT
jgi:asparagine synthase (glutamine-hydrolysing)